LFCDDNNLDIDAYILILNDCIQKGLFSEKLYKKYSIITSARIQKNYCDAVQRRKGADFFKEYLLIKPSEALPEKVNVNIERLNVDNKAKNASNGTQKKGEESKKKKKGKYSAEFLEWYDSYPNKDAKARAAKKYDKIIKSIPHSTMIKRRDEYAAYVVATETERRFIKNAANYLEDEYYETDYADKLRLDTKPKSTNPFDHMD
jgi:hypothetical protein